MIIYIPAEDLNIEVVNLFQNPAGLHQIYNLVIDYWTQTLEGTYKGVEYVLVNFEDYDMKLSNRWVDYKLEWVTIRNETALRIEFISTRGFVWKYEKK